MARRAIRYAIVSFCHYTTVYRVSRKRSMLVIPRVRPEDSGKYECRGTGVQTGHVAITSAQVIVNSKPDNSEYIKQITMLTTK